MKKTLTLGLAIFCLFISFTFAQCISEVSASEPSVQNGLSTFALVGTNSTAGAQIWVAHRSIGPYSNTPWFEETRFTMPVECVGFIYGWQKDTATMSKYETLLFRGWMLDNDTLYRTGIKFYKKNRLPAHLAYISRNARIGNINPEYIINPEVFTNSDGVLDFSNITFGTDGDYAEEEIKENLLDGIWFGNTSNGFVIRNPSQLPIQISVSDLTGKILYQIERTEADRFQYSSDDVFKSSGLYIVTMSHGSGVRSEKLVIVK
ncbi:MAG: T9SS type A sorting domain-containing protein [Candidatus Pacebacteria bacterium]|nr:T9SS type A sorting domain-containing protein [Candidatus Paceibacterota bacterium]